MTTLPALTPASPLDASDDSRLSFTTSANGSTEVLQRDLGAVPANFETMDALSWAVEHRVVGRSDDTLSLDIRIMGPDGTATIGVASPLDASDDSRHVFPNGVASTSTYTFDDMPADFLRMVSVEYETESRRLGITDDICWFYVGIKTAGGVFLAGNDSSSRWPVTASGDVGTDTVIGPAAFPYVDTAAEKADWDAAVVHVEQSYNVSGTNDNGHREVDRIQFHLTYITTAGVLAAADSAGTFQSVSAAVTSATDVTAGPTAFTYVHPTADKTAWEGGIVELRQTYSQSMANDGALIEVDHVEFTGDYTASGPGTFSATATSELPGFEQAASGTFVPPTVSGTASSQLPGFEQAASGTHAPPSFSATAGSVLPGFDQAATGTVTPPPLFEATATSELPGFEQAAAGTHTPPTFAGTATSELPGFTQLAEGNVGLPATGGAAASRLPGFTQAATGTHQPPVFTATTTSELPGFTQAAEGSHVPSLSTGTASSELPGFDQAAEGTVTPPTFAATAGSELPGFAQSAEGTHTPPAFTGTAASTLPGFTQAASGQFASTVTGTMGSTLPGFSQSATGLFDPPVFAGSITSSLPGFSQRALQQLPATPPERIIIVRAENRSTIVEADRRIMRVRAEDRVNRGGTP